VEVIHTGLPIWASILLSYAHPIEVRTGDASTTGCGGDTLRDAARCRLHATGSTATPATAERAEDAIRPPNLGDTVSDGRSGGSRRGSSGGGLSQVFRRLNRLGMAGGSDKLTRILLDTTSGQHQLHYLSVLREAKKLHLHQTRPGTLIGMSITSRSALSMHLTACEDYSKTSWIRPDGSKLPTEHPLRYFQHATAKKGKDHKWRIDFVETTDVKSFKGLPCDKGSR